MRKINTFLLLAGLLVLLGACSAKHGIGYVNNEFVWRQSFGDIKTEVSLGGSVANSFDDRTAYYLGDEIPGNEKRYKSQETGSVNTCASLGLAAYYRIFKNDIFDVSAGLKYRNYFSAAYQYLYYFENYVNYPYERLYHYDESLEINFFSKHKISLMFPDVEIKCPFMENMKFTFSAELVYVKWKNKGGNYLYNFRQDVSTVSGYAEDAVETVNRPGAADSVSFSSDFFNLGSINLGVLYYF
jgi:hypothetical protein